MFPDDPVIEETSEWLFARPDSPLSPVGMDHGINSPLLTVPAFRRALSSALHDDSVLGKAIKSSEGVLSFVLNNGVGGGSNTPEHDPRQAPPGTERPIRAKDLAAWQLSELDGAPEFQLDWPESDKNTAIDTIAVFLRIHQDELRAFPAKPQDTSCPGDDYVYLGH
jgi:hypothetical protein